MSANLSLILNLLLLAGIIVAITRLVQQRQSPSNSNSEKKEPGLGESEPAEDADVIAVRRVHDESPEPALEPKANSAHPPLQSSTAAAGKSGHNTASTSQNDATPDPLANPVMIFIAAKKDRQFAGYELLQAILSAGLRYGEGNLFHRHQGDNGQGTLMCSLAAASESGQFNLNRMGAFSCRGLCLFMEACANNSIDRERFTVMQDVAQHLAEELDAIVLDEQHRPFRESSLPYYEQRLGCELAMAVEAD